MNLASARKVSRFWIIRCDYCFKPLLLVKSAASIKPVQSGETWLQASSRKLQALIDACFRPSAINGINEGV